MDTTPLKPTLGLTDKDFTTGSCTPKPRRVVGTLNNYTDAHLLEMRQFCMDPAKVKWGIIGLETAPTTGTPHLQFSIVFAKQILFKTLKKMKCFENAFLATMRGSPAQCQAYCSKSGKYFEYGEKPAPGKRSDLTGVVEKMRGGASLKDLVMDLEGAVAVVKYHNGLSKLRTLLDKPQQRDIYVYWISGPTGTGKSKLAHELGSSVYGSDYWCSGPDLQWFDGYCGQKYAIFDDLRPKHCTFSFLLRLLDRYPLRVPYKGGFTAWTPETVVITAPHTPDGMFYLRSRNLPEEIGQLTRRIRRSFCFVKDWDTAGVPNPNIFTKYDTALEEILQDLLDRTGSQLPSGGATPTHNLSSGSNATEEDHEGDEGDRSFNTPGGQADNICTSFSIASLPNSESSSHEEVPQAQERGEDYLEEEDIGCDVSGAHSPFQETQEYPFEENTLSAEEVSLNVTSSQ